MYKLEKFDKGKIDIDSFHINLLENNIWGFDSLSYALQIASLNLVFHNPSVPLKNMNFFLAPLGIDEEGKTQLGSLRFMKTHTLADHFSVEQKAKKVTAVDIEFQSEGIPYFDLIVMNPPFTRATGRGGKEKGGLFGFIIDDKARNKLTKNFEHLRLLISKTLNNECKEYLDVFEAGTFDSIGAAGEGFLFLYLAQQYVKDKGKISFVLPRSFLSGASWFLIRALILKKFHIEYVIVSYDKKNGYNFSESTKLSEAMIIATKEKSKDEALTDFVMLLSKPKTTFESKALAKSIINNTGFAQIGNASAYITSISKKELFQNLDNWGSFVAFPHIRLLEFVKRLVTGSLFDKPIPITKLSKISSIGIDWQQFNSNFKLSKTFVSGSYPLIYGGKEEQKMHLIGKFNGFIVPISEKSEKLFQQKASQLLVPDRIRITTSHVISIFIESKSLSNVFYAVKLNPPIDNLHHKALCCWFNSTFGLLLILSNRVETEGAWGRLKLSHWRLQNVLDVTILNKDIIEKLSKVLDNYGKMEFARLPQQYDISQKSNRLRLDFDLEFLRAIGINATSEELFDLYNMISQSFGQWFNAEMNSPISKEIRA